MRERPVRTAVGRRPGGRWRSVGAAVACTVLVAITTGRAPVRAQEAPTVTTHVVTSFDGTQILAHLFVPAGVTDADPAPLVLRTHGWGGAGQATPDGFVGELLEAGYVVLTWDQRGFGCSGGEVHVNKPEVEGRDVSALIDWAVANAPVETGDDGEPMVGMTGGSYAGAIQTATSALDDRIDAIAPEVSWSDLRYTLYAGEVVNQGWAALLYGAGLATSTALGVDPSCPTFPETGGLHPALTQGFVEGTTTGVISEEVLEFLADSSLARYGADDPVAIPTLVVQGSTDTLFDLTDGWGIVEHVRAAGAPARFLVFCGGHVACPDTYEDAGDGERMRAAVHAWLARHLRGDTSVEVGAPVEYRTNEGVWRTATDFPPPGAGAVTASGSGSLASVPSLDVPDVEALVDTFVSYGGGIPALPVTAAQVSEAGDPRAMTIEVARAGDEPIEILGVPSVDLAVDGVGTEIILMAKLVHREAGHVLNLQEGAVRVALLDGPTTADVPMPGLAYTVPAGHHLDLQVSTASVMHANARLPATAEVTATVAVPVIESADATGGPAAPPAASPASPDAGPPADAVPAPVLPATGAATRGPVALALLGPALALALVLRHRHRPTA